MKLREHPLLLYFKNPKRLLWVGLAGAVLLEVLYQLFKGTSWLGK